MSFVSRFRGPWAMLPLLALGGAPWAPSGALPAGFGPDPVQDPAAEAAPLPVRVNDAIARGVQHLFDTQLSDGRWLGDETRYPGGLTAFTAYALAKSGVRRNDPRLDLALRALADIEPRSTYGRSARLLLYSTRGDAAHWRPAAQGCLDELLATQRDGVWGYPEDPLDLSNVQFALLGLHAAEGLGLTVPDAALEDCARSLLEFQEGGKNGGGFFYREGVPVTGSITAAGLGNLGLLERFAEERPGLARILKKQRGRIAGAHEWLVEHWNPERNAWGERSWTPSWHHAYLWAVQRYGELSGQTHLGEHDWYREGAEFLVASQAEDGGWGTRSEDTCFALLFLRRTTFSGAGEVADLEAPREVRRRTAPPRLSADAPFLTDWLVAGPFPGKPEETGLWDPPFSPERVRVKEGSRVGRKKWKRTALSDTTWTNLEEVAGAKVDHGLWALATRIALTEPFEGLLWFTFEDGWRVYLDGAEISTGNRVQAPLTPTVRVPLALGAGEHVLVVLAEDVVGVSAFAARLSGPTGEAPARLPEVGLGR